MTAQLEMLSKYTGLSNLHVDLHVHVVPFRYTWKHKRTETTLISTIKENQYPTE